MCPVLAHSKFASSKSYEGCPTAGIEQLRAMAKSFPGCNWALATGSLSGVIALQVDGESGHAALGRLCYGDTEWCHTLQAYAGTTHYIYFAAPGRGKRIRYIAGFADLKMHVGTFVLVPPSWLVSGVRFRYLDLDAEVAATPDWLLM